MNNDGQEKTDLAREKNERQQRKLVKAVLNHDARMLGEKDVEITEAEWERFFRMRASGQIKKADLAKMVEGIQGPVESDGEEAVFEKIKTSNFKRRILAYMTGVGFDNYENLRPDHVVDFVKKYPTPEKFESAARDFLLAIKRSNPEEKYQQYAAAMLEFSAEMYGKALEYWQQAQVLSEQAEEWQLDQESAGLLDDFLTPGELSGDGWLQGGQIYMLTPELLKKAGLMPRFLMEVGGVQIALSKVFMVDVHEAAIAYVKTHGAVKIRGYYRSNSQGMWRLLADYVGGDGEIAWYGVGFNEESLTLPMKIQKQLNMIAKRGIYEIPGINTGFFLGGTARRFNSKEEYKQLVAEGRMDSDYYREVSREPRLNFGTLSTLKHPPESIDIDKGDAPDFRKQLDHYTMKTEMYGEVTVRQFASYNDSLRYTMCDVGHGDDKKAWVGGIEVNAPITSTGLKAEWVSTGDVGTPLLEYQTMTGGYGERGNRTDGYESMWERYLKLVPIIRRYLYTWREG